MASNILSRLIPSVHGSPSIYETIRQHDEDSDLSDVEERAGLSVDEGEFAEQPENVELNAVHPDYVDTTPRSIDARPSKGPGGKTHTTKPLKRARRSRWMATRGLGEVEEAEDDVPASLLIEDSPGQPGRRLVNLPPPPSLDLDPVPVAGPPDARTERQWQRTREQHNIHEAQTVRPSRQPGGRARGFNALAVADPKLKAIWRWTNVQNLDNFLARVYDYYLGHGFWAINLHRFYNLITWAFVVGFSFFLTQCIDYHQLRGSTRMSQIIVAQCTRKMGPLPNIVLWLTSLLWLTKMYQYVIDIPRLIHMHDFYLHLLDVPESEIQTITWQEIVSRLMSLRDANPHTATGENNPTSRRFLGTQNKQRMDAHDIANRLMRKENYLIAMFNKDILDMTLTIPLLGRRQFFSRTLEWNIYQCIIDLVFNQRGQVKPFFLKATYRNELSQALRRRFIFAGFANLIIAPIIITYNLVDFFFQNFNEYQKNPAQIGARRYNPLAEWKFREFNEVWHIFERRMNMSYPFASRYIDQFPKVKTVQSARFVTFITGAMIAVLAVASALDPDLFFGFEITKDRTVLFYVTVFGSIWAVARGLLPDENSVHDTEYTMSEVIQFTHYCPPHWHGRLNSDAVRREFAQLYQLKILIFLEEVFSMFFAPFVLWYSLPKCSERIIDFFREFTVHVDGLGYVCSFAEFNFQKNGNVPPSDPLQPPNPNERQGLNGVAIGGGLRDDFYSTKNQKLEASYWSFMNDYARNPKTDIRFPYHANLTAQRQHQQSRFHPPPPVPGLPSPTLRSTDLHSGEQVLNTGTGAKPGSILQQLSSPRRAGVGFQSGTPRFVAHGVGEKSPLHSMLLDPHHQPSGSGFMGGLGSPVALRPSKMGGMVTTLGKSHLGKQGVLLERDEENEELATTEQKQQQTTDWTTKNTTGEESAGELGSWKIDHNDEDDESEDEEDGGLDAITGPTATRPAAGVLGLLKEFQRTQGEARVGLAGGGPGIVRGAL